MKTKSPQPDQFDDVLRKMLATPPAPHKPDKPQKAKKLKPKKPA